LRMRCSFERRKACTRSRSVWKGLVT